MKRCIVTLLNCSIFALLLAFLLPIAWAQNPEDVARKYGITFPIVELGNCSNYSECRDFCEDPVNYDQCIDFAKKKGFYNEEKVTVDIRNSDFWSKTQAELGCNSMVSCQSFCENPTNFDKCDAFAKKHNLSGGHVNNPHEQQFLTKAKEILGCDSPSSCMNFCSNEENWKKCSEFAKQMGFRGGEVRAGPGGCTSEETCRAFCSDPNNYQICSGFTSSAGGSFSGPGGCNSEESCQSYCEQHPQECGYTGGGLKETDYNPSEMCNKTPDCSWVNNSCQCSESPSETYSQPTGTNYEAVIPNSTYDPATECAKQTGCSWTGSSCQCSSNNSTSY